MSMNMLYLPDCILRSMTCIVSGQWYSFGQNALWPLNFLNKCHCKVLARCTLSCCLFFISSAAFDIWNVFAHLLLFKCRTSCAKHSFMCSYSNWWPSLVVCPPLILLQVALMSSSLWMPWFCNNCTPLCFYSVKHFTKPLDEAWFTPILFQTVISVCINQWFCCQCLAKKWKYSHILK